MGMKGGYSQRELQQRERELSMKKGSNMKDVLKVIAAVAMLVGMVIVMWKFKWIILGAIVLLSIVLVGSNAVYRKIIGKDMPIYTRIMKD